VPAVKRRNRIVVFRLTQEEYESLKDVCVNRGARNISDFARSALLRFMGADGQTAVDQRLAELEATVRRLAQLLETLVSRSAEIRQEE
jgi:hypothetical protein